MTHALKVAAIKRMERMQAECNGMTRQQAARHLGVTVGVVDAYRRATGFAGLVRGNQTPMSEQTKRILEAAPALAERGLTKSDAAREMGVLPPVFTTAVLRHLPDLQWRDGREDGRGGKKR